MRIFFVNKTKKKASFLFYFDFLFVFKRSQTLNGLNWRRLIDFFTTRSSCNIIDRSMD